MRGLYMQFFSIMLFAVSSNLDNLIIGVSYGIKKIRIPFLSNFLIAVMAFAGTFLSMLCGERITQWLPVGLANAIGSVMIIVIGLGGLIKYLYSRRRSAQDNVQWPINEPEKYDKNSDKTLELKETVSLGIALTVNNIGLGVGASMSGLSVLGTAMMSSVFCMGLMLIGNYIGKGCTSKRFEKYSEVISAVIIILLGIFELLA